MIIKLNESHKEKILNLVEEEKELNLFIIGDLENYGFNEDFIDYWGEWNGKEELTALLLRFYEGFIVYSKGEFNVKGFLDIMKEHNFEMISGEKSILEKFSSLYEFGKKRDMYFAKLESDEKLYKGDILNSVLQTKIEDVKLIKELFEHISQFQNDDPLERMEKKYIDKSGRGFHIKNSNGEVVSNAETSAENSGSAMVMAVCSHPDYRKTGYASAVVSKLCQELLNEGKSLCLFYDNPKAGDIYKRLGFEDIGIWSMWNNKE